MERPMEAMDAIERALALKPEDVDALVLKAAIHDQLAQFGEAVAALDHALRLRPNDAHLWKGRVLLFLRWLDKGEKEPQGLWQLREEMYATIACANALEKTLPDYEPPPE